MTDINQRDMEATLQVLTRYSNASKNLRLVLEDMQLASKRIAASGNIGGQKHREFCSIIQEITTVYEEFSDRIGRSAARLQDFQR